MKQLIQQIEDICRQEDWVFDQPTVSYILALLKLPKPPAPEVIVKEATKDLPHPDEITTFTQFYASLPYLPHRSRKTIQNRVLRHTPPEDWPTYLPIPVHPTTLARIKQTPYSRHADTAKARVAIMNDTTASTTPASELAQKYGVSESLVRSIRPRKPTTDPQLLTNLVQQVEHYCRANDATFTASTIEKMGLPNPREILKHAQDIHPREFRLGRRPELIQTPEDYQQALPYIHKVHRRPTLERLQQTSQPDYAAAREAIKANPYADSIANLARTYGISRALVSKIRKEAAGSTAQRPSTPSGSQPT